MATKKPATKPVKKTAPKRQAAIITRKSNSRNTGGRAQSDAERQVRKFAGLNNVLQSQIGCIAPPYNPFELISYRNGYHWDCINALTAAAAGQGYEAHPELKAHIDKPNPDYSFNELLLRTTDDFLVNGWFTVNVARGDTTANIWHAPSIKTRAKIDPKSRKLSYVRYEYDPVTGWMSYVEETPS
jgi:hypothetical protein